MNTRIVSIGIAAVACLAPITAGADTSTTGNAPAIPTPVYLLCEGQAYNFIGAGVDQMTVHLHDDATGALLARTTTNHYGDFRLESEATHTGKGTLTLSKAQHKTATLSVILEAQEDVPFLEVEIEGALVLKGQVTDKRTGKPVANAKVSGDAGYKDWKDKTDVEGRFEITGLFPVPLELRVEAEGFARAQQRLAPEKLGEAQLVALEAERILQLLVVGEDGAPIAGVHVECLAGPPQEQDFRQCATDRKGEAILRGLASATISAYLRLSHDTHVSDAEFDRAVTLDATTVTTHARLVMQRAGSIAGTIRSAADRAPLSGARVSAGAFLSDHAPRAWSNLDGTYQLNGVPTGSVPVTVQRAGNGPELRVVEVRAGEVTRLDVPLPAARRVRGQVLGSEEKPVDGAYLMITRWRDYESIGLRCITDQQGRFEFTDAPADAFDVSVEARGFEPLVDAPVKAGSGDLVFRLEPGKAPAETRRKGEPAPDFEVKLLDGTTVRGADLRGKIVLLDFWATWCGPCVREIPNLRQAWEIVRQRDDVVMLSIASEENSARFRKFIEAQRMPWLHAAGEANIRPVSQAYGVRGIPAIFLIDRDGKIADTGLRGPEIRTSLEKALATADDGT